ncbi:hypothetical protein [Isobaculum melis]|uniref:ESAT-6 secretion machinery protein EssA n=1 Tax=Isobaculum melis TaxID=142588 RepID=A0A1H9QCV1_9LACT|nr:hypothetical protein [Isobaculum melis]SER58361.1 hypothetical protein SAMN04488559_1024 [Isobaculum melis]
MKLMKRITPMIVLLAILLYPKTTAFATTELKDNQLDMKTNRIEAKTGEKEIQGGNNETLFDETIMNELSEKMEKEAAEKAAKAEKIFIQEMKDATLYDPSGLFNEPENAQPISQTTKTTTEAPVNHTNTLLLTGGSFVTVVGGAIASVLNYKKGD